MARITTQDDRGQNPETLAETQLETRVDTRDAEEKAAVAQMPPIWLGRRRSLLVYLVLLGLLQAVLAVMMSINVDTILNEPGVYDRWDIISLLVSVLGIGLARWVERVVAEELGQDYVAEQRRRLIATAVGDAQYRGSLGVTVTRASNDLTAVRNWVALGIVPLVTGIPLILVVVGALIVIHPLIGLAVSFPLIALGLSMPFLARQTLRRARELRRRRGRMSARIADTVMASESVRASGALARELNAIDRDSSRVVGAAVHRAWITGLTRSLTATVATLCTVVVVLLSSQGWIAAPEVASTMTLLGVLATPVNDMGRVVEYRQNFRAASRILAPLLSTADELKAREEKRQKQWRKHHAGTLDVDPSLPRGLAINNVIANNQLIPSLTARPGERIRIVSSDPHHIRLTLNSLSGLNEPQKMSVDSHDYGLAPEKVRRALVGVASVHIPLERGSVKRLATLRVPSASDEEIQHMLGSLGLNEIIDADDRGWNLKLKSGGLPWSNTHVALLKCARALLGPPSLVILDGIDSVLDETGLARLRAVLEDFEGVVLMVTARPEALVSEWSEWSIDGEIVDLDPAFDDYDDGGE